MQSTIEHHEGLPIFDVERATHDPNILTFRCPSCRRDHTHGAGGDMGAGITYRAAHCAGASGYYLRVPAASPRARHVLA